MKTHFLTIGSSDIVIRKTVVYCKEVLFKIRVNKPFFPHWTRCVRMSLGLLYQRVVTSHSSSLGGNLFCWMWKWCKSWKSFDSHDLTKNHVHVPMNLYINTVSFWETFNGWKEPLCDFWSALERLVPAKLLCGYIEMVNDLNPSYVTF